MSDEIKKISIAEVKEHNKDSDLWVIINDKIYDLTKFREEHPGGGEVLDEVAGKDGTKEFDDIGHSLDAKKQMEQYLIGVLPDEEKKQKKSQGGSGFCNNKKCFFTMIGSGIALGIGAALIVKAIQMKKSL